MRDASAATGLLLGAVLALVPWLAPAVSARAAWIAGRPRRERAFAGL